MESPILKQIVKFLQTRKKQKQWMVVFVFMAVIVGFGTVIALKMRAGDDLQGKGVGLPTGAA